MDLISYNANKLKRNMVRSGVEEHVARKIIIFFKLDCYQNQLKRANQTCLTAK